MSRPILQMLRDSTIYGIGSVLSRVSGVILLPILTRLFDPSDFGAIELIQTYLAFVLLVCALTMESALLRYFNDYEFKSELVSTVFYSILLSGLIGAGIIYFSSNTLSRMIVGDDHLSNILTIGSLTIPATLLYAITSTVLRAQVRALSVSILMVLNSLLYLLASIAYLFGISRGIEAVFWGRLCADGFCTLFALWLARDMYRMHFSKIVFCRLLRFGIPLLPEKLATFSASNINKAILLHFGSIAIVGNLAVAIRFRLMFSLLVMSFRQAWVPVAYSISRSANAPEIYARVFELYTCALAPFALAMVFFSGEFLQLVAGQGYETAERVLPIFVVTPFVLGSHYIFTFGLLLREKTFLITLASFISSGIGAILQYILIQKYGLLGSAMAGLMMGITQSVLVYFLAQRHYPVPYRLAMVLVQLAVVGLALTAEIWRGYPLWSRVVLFALFSGGFIRKGVAQFLNRGMSLESLLRSPARSGHD